MLPLRLVLDTDVLVSAALNSNSIPRTAFLIAITRPARLYVSAPILEEYARVISRPELAIRKGPRLQLLQIITNRARQIPHRVVFRSPVIRMTTSSSSAPMRLAPTSSLPAIPAISRHSGRAQKSLLPANS